MEILLEILARLPTRKDIYAFASTTYEIQYFIEEVLKNPLFYPKWFESNGLEYTTSNPKLLFELLAAPSTKNLPVLIVNYSKKYGELVAVELLEDLFNLGKIETKEGLLEVFKIFILSKEEKLAIATFNRLPNIPGSTIKYIPTSVGSTDLTDMMIKNDMIELIKLMLVNQDSKYYTVGILAGAIGSKNRKVVESILEVLPLDKMVPQLRLQVEQFLASEN